MKPLVRLGLMLLCGVCLSGLLPALGTMDWAELRLTLAPQATLAMPEPPIQTTPPGGAVETKLEEGGQKPFAEVTKDLTPIPGLFTLYRNRETNKALMGIRPDQLNQNMLLIATLESGLGEAGLFRGWPVNDLMIQFRAAPDQKLQVVVPNLYFRNRQGQPQDRQARPDSFSDSVLFALPVVSTHPDNGEMLVDLTDFLVTRDPANLLGSFPWVMASYTLNAETSYLGAAKAFPNNVELEAVLGFASGSRSDPLAFLFGVGLGSLPDSRGFNLRVRYSLSALSQNPAFQPRPADQRVGYFVTAYRTPVQGRSQDPFTRYIQRWHLEKQDPTAALSHPRQPIVFWLENTIPPPYRQAIREGAEWWNTAFERAGFLQAIEVRQMPDQADWDPADVRYNVIRWSDSFEPWALGLGPSRVNPLTGEILDADVILDASVVGFLNEQYETFRPTLEAATQSPLLQICGHPLQHHWFQRLAGAPATTQSGASPLRSQAIGLPSEANPCAGIKAFEQMAFGALALDTLGPALTRGEDQEAYVQAYVRALSAHEVGHVLGLRHNFLGSTLLPPETLNDPSTTRQLGLVSSVMDYFPPNIAPPNQVQGDYFPTRLGPYDLWAIEYGYKPTPNPLTAQRELQQVANRAGAPELAYATDEDIFDWLDPKANAWDLSSDPLHYALGQIDTAQAIWAKLNWFSLNPGETYGLLRRRVDLVFNYYLQQAFTISNYIGGQRFKRTDPWSSRGQPPFEPIAAADQRHALATLSREVLVADAIQLPPELIRLLAPDRWLHWGQPLTLSPLDYPIYDRILFVQALVLSDVLYGDRLVRLRDAELKAPTADSLTLAEVFDTLGQAVWGELLQPGPEPVAPSSLRRALQRHHLNILTRLFLRRANPNEGFTDFLDFLAQETTFGAPDDARLLARHQLKQLQEAVEQYRHRFGRQLDMTTLAYLEDVGDHITQVLESSFIRQ